MPRKPKNVPQVPSTSAAIPSERLDQLVRGPMTPQDFESMFRGLKTAILARALGAELTHHVGYEKDQVKPGGQGNQRNGTSPKTVITADGRWRWRCRATRRHLRAADRAQARAALCRVRQEDTSPCTRAA